MWSRTSKPGRRWAPRWKTRPNSSTGAVANGGNIGGFAVVTGVTAAFWQDLYKGNFGRVAAGFEWGSQVPSPLAAKLGGPLI
jgi:hypothetical protein